MSRDWYFYPRSPCGERRRRTCQQVEKQAFLSTLSLRRATWLRCWQLAARDISIHALLAESDPNRCATAPNFRYFYPRSPCGERRTTTITICTASRFLSTLSLRRATHTNNSTNANLHFYPRSPCGERQPATRRHNKNNIFYPRSPCGERHTPTKAYNITMGFLSTLSLRRATKCSFGNPYKKPFFYPRSPCGERRLIGLPGWLRVLFSIHALLAESDTFVNCNCNFTQNFLSTLSLRRATW